MKETWLIPALTIGVDYALFLTLDPISIKPFFKAYKMKCKEQIAMTNISAWYNGIYVMNAIGACFSKNEKYPSSPIDFSKDNEIPLDEKLKIWAINVNAEFDRNHPNENISEENYIDKSEGQ